MKYFVVLACAIAFAAAQIHNPGGQHHGGSGVHHPHPNGPMQCHVDWECNGCPTNQTNICLHGECRCLEARARRATACTSDADCSFHSCGDHGAYCHMDHGHHHNTGATGHCTCHASNTCMVDTDCAKSCTNGTAVCHHGQGQTRGHCQCHAIHPDNSCQNNTDCKGCTNGTTAVCHISSGNTVGHCQCHNTQQAQPIKRAATCTNDADCSFHSCGTHGAYCHMNHGHHLAAGHCTCHTDNTCMTATDCAKFCINATAVCHMDHGHGHVGGHCQCHAIQPAPTTPAPTTQAATTQAPTTQANSTQASTNTALPPIKRAATCTSDADCSFHSCGTHGAYCHMDHGHHQAAGHCTCHADNTCMTETDCAKFCINATAVCHMDHGHGHIGGHCQCHAIQPAPTAPAATTQAPTTAAPTTQAVSTPASTTPAATTPAPTTQAVTTQAATTATSDTCLIDADCMKGCVNKTGVCLLGQCQCFDNIGPTALPPGRREADTKHCHFDDSVCAGWPCHHGSYPYCNENNVCACQHIRREAVTPCHNSLCDGYSCPHGSYPYCTSNNVCACQHH